MGNFKLGNIEFYLGLEATGKTVTVTAEESASSTAIEVTGADIADIKKNDQMYLMKVGTLDEYIFVVSEATGTLTVIRDWFENTPLVIPANTVLTEYKFIKRKITEDVEVNGENLVQAVRVESTDGVEDILFDTEKEEPKISATFLDSDDVDYIKTQCPIIWTKKTTGAIEKTITGSVGEYSAQDYTIPCMIAFRNLGYNAFNYVFPKLTLLSVPTESFPKGSVFKQKVDFAAMKTDLENYYIQNSISS